MIAVADNVVIELLENAIERNGSESVAQFLRITKDVA